MTSASNQISASVDSDAVIIQDMREKFDAMYRITRGDTKVDWKTRFKRLDAIEHLINHNREAVAEAISADFGHRSKSETLLLEIFPLLEAVRQAKRCGKEWMQTRKVTTNKWFLPASSYIYNQPLGVVGIISPWNYPLYLSIGPLIAALVAGNRAMLKVSECLPNFEKWLKETLPNYFHEDEVCLIEGELEVAQAFSSLPFDHLFFTGSSSVGKHVMRAAAENLTPVTLELGGKSPAMILDKESLENAVARVWTGKMLNSGQTCIAPDYVLIPKHMQDEFITLSKAWIDKHYPKLKTNADFSYLVNQRQHKRVTGYLEDAKNLGVTLHPMSDASADVESGFMPPMIATDLPENAKLLTEEIFAPILPIVNIDDVDDAIRYVNERPRPLALYVFSDTDEINDNVVMSTVSGGVSVNDTLYHIVQENLPFGGVGNSGMGRYHGKFGFDTFSHEKAVFKQSAINFVNVTRPPYGKVFNNMLKLMTRV